MTDSDTPDSADGLDPRPTAGIESTALTIRAAGGRALSKEQRNFNRLTKRIADLEREIGAERDKLDLLLERYHEKVTPLVNTLARRQLDLAKALARAVGRLAPRKRQEALLRAMILDLCGEALCVETPDAEAEALYDAWAETSYREELRRKAEAGKKVLADELRERFGAEACGDEESPEEIARQLRRLEEQARADSTPEIAGPRRRKSKRRDQDERREQREALTRKSVRSIYLSLAKVLHPDAVPDADERSLREDYMKQATAAYRQGDLTSLLKLEHRWVIRADTGMHARSDEALRAYLPALREQVARLDEALRSQFLDPRYFPIGPVAAMTLKTALFSLGEWARGLRMENAALEQDLEFVRRCTSGSELAAFAREYLEAREEQLESAEASATADSGDD